MTLYACRKVTLDENLSKTNDPDSVVSETNGSAATRSGTFTSIEGEIQLGAQVANPLTVQNMMQAWNNLYVQQLTTLEHTHLYVRFLPTFEEYEILQEMEELELIDYPLDREIVQDGSYYHDPSIPADEITWQYAVVEKDFVPPVATSNYEVLSQLVVVEYNSHWVEEAYRIKGLFYDGAPYGHLVSTKPIIAPPGEEALIPEIIECPPNCVPVLLEVGEPPEWEWEWDCSNPPPPPTTACGCSPVANPRHPSGAVRVWDTQHGGGQWEGVQSVRITTWRKNVGFGWVFKKHTYTDLDGCWHIDKSYEKFIGSGSATIGLKMEFKNDKIVIRGMSHIADLPGYFETVTQHFTYTGTDFRDICIDIGVADAGEARKRYFAATTMNAFYNYNYYAGLDGIPQIEDLDILLHPFTANAAAPMFDQMNGNLLNELVQLYGVTNMLNAQTQGLGTGVISIAAAAWLFAPDILHGYAGATLDGPGRGLRSDVIKETLFHEFAHASHFTQVSNEYWIDNIEYVTNNEINNNNPPYGTLPTPGSGRCGVIEMWGFHYGPTLADRKYGLEHSNPVGPGFSQETERYINRLERTLNFSAAGVIPAGLSHDLIDVVNTPGEAAASDVFGGFTHFTIFNEMNDNILTPTDLRVPLSGVAPSGVTGTQINALFGDYGF